MDILYVYIHYMYIQDKAFKVLQAIISESMRWIKNMSDKSEFEGDIRWYHLFDLGVVNVREKSLLIF